jgi:hypothetical protein
MSDNFDLLLEGGRPNHVHICDHDESGKPGSINRPTMAFAGHQWKCDSPYCLNISRRCPTHAGPEPRHD